MKKYIFIASILFALPAISFGAVTYNRTPSGTGDIISASTVNVSFSFDDWTADGMDFTDIFDNQQNYWWIDVGSNSETGTYYAYSPCYASSTTAANYDFTFPIDPTEYPIKIKINAASDLSNCNSQFGGQRDLTGTDGSLGILWSAPDTIVGQQIDTMTGSVSDNVGVLVHKYWPALLASSTILVVWGFGKLILPFFF